MDFLILFLILSTISINGINSDKHCSEQKCISDLSQWCCSYNTTCGSVNMCNDIAQARSTSYCIGSVACISDPYYWCCGSDQTCGGFRRCNDGGAAITQIIIGSIVGPGIFLVSCIAYLCYRLFQKNNSNRRRIFTSTNQRAHDSVYISANGPTTTANPYGQVYTIPTHPGHVMEREAPPSTYDMAITSSTTQNKDNI